MTIELANTVCERFHQLMFMYMDSEMVECGDDPQHNMDQLLRGNLTSIVFRHDGKLVMVYVPNYATQFIFDAYAE